MRQILQLIPILLVTTAFTSCQLDDVIININVDSEQQISATHGNFNGTLRDDDRFGSALAAIGDLEADGVVDLAVGAPGDDDGGSDRGAVWFLFMNDDGTVDTEQKISDTDGDFKGTLRDGDVFGSAVTGMGDLNGDAILDIAVGAPGDDDGGTDRGAVWILFLNQDGTVQDEIKISSTDGNFDGDLDDNDRFGAALAVLGDLDGDGIPDLAAGAPGDDEDSTDAGAVWILFMNRNGTVRTEQKIAFDTGGLDALLRSGDAFGSAIANIDDLNLDAVSDIVVGAPGDDDGGLDAGAAWVLYLSASGHVIDQQKLSTLEGDFEGAIRAGDGFGTALANAGDVDLDGISDLLAGTPGDDDGGIDSGAAWLLFPGRDGKVNGAQKLSPREGLLGALLNSGDRFGSAVAGIGNLDRERATDLAVGAPFTDADGIDTGSVWILFMDKADTATECERNAIFRFLGIVDCR
ncbi:MAG TPA: integrin alpha [Gammaproteobacteria bacterium]|nr:integrin alpha [Gammaproteobacteria bacterium]